MSEEISILAEIDDALRADKAQQFWKDYGKLILAGCVGILALTGISAYWKNHLAEENIERTHVMLQASTAADDKQFEDALKTLNPDAKSWEGGRAGTVHLQAAEIYLKSGQRDKAIAELKTVIAGSADIAVHDSAVLRLAALTDSADVSPADQAGRPFTALALQVKAAALMKQGKNKEAADALNAVIASSPAFSAEHLSASELLPLTEQAAVK